LLGLAAWSACLVEPQQQPMSTQAAILCLRSAGCTGLCGSGAAAEGAGPRG
jgi:hypothetical protein